MPPDLTTADTFCLDPVYSTTRLVTQESPVIENQPDAKFATVLLSPESEGRKGDGGLRAQGYFKQRLPNKPLITVITVVYNGEKFLENTILSVLNQSYDNVEYIVIDGGSTDGTVDIIKKYERQIDYWVSEKDRGIYDAMNKSLDIAFGDWQIFLGADDVLNDCFAYVASQLVRHEAVFYGNVELASSGELCGGHFNRYRLMQQNICHQAIFYPRSIYQDKRYDMRCSFLADYKYNIELWGDDISFIYIPVNVAKFNDQGLSSEGDEYFQEVKMSLIFHELGLPLWTIKIIRNFLVFCFKAKVNK